MKIFQRKVKKRNMKSSSRRKEKSQNRKIRKQRKRENVKSIKIKKKSLNKQKRKLKKRGRKNKKNSKQNNDNTIDYGACIMKMKDFASRMKKANNLDQQAKRIGDFDKIIKNKKEKSGSFEESLAALTKGTLMYFNNMHI